MDKAEYISNLLAEMNDDAATTKDLQWMGEELRDEIYASTLSYRSTMIVLVNALFAWGFDVECCDSNPCEPPKEITRWDAMRFVRDYIDQQIAEGERKARPT